MRKLFVAVLLVLLLTGIGVYAQSEEDAEYTTAGDEWPVYLGDEGLVEQLNMTLIRNDHPLRLNYISPSAAREALEAGDRLVIGGTSFMNMVTGEDSSDEAPIDVRYVAIGDYDEYTTTYNSRPVAIAVPIEKPSELRIHYSNEKTIFYYVEYTGNLEMEDGSSIPSFFAYAWAPNVLVEGNEFDWPEGFVLDPEDRVPAAEE
jgi:hypothetical protein